MESTAESRVLSSLSRLPVVNVQELPSYDPVSNKCTGNVKVHMDGICPEAEHPSWPDTTLDIILSLSEDQNYVLELARMGDESSFHIPMHKIKVKLETMILFEMVELDYDNEYKIWSPNAESWVTTLETIAKVSVERQMVLDEKVNNDSMKREGTVTNSSVSMATFARDLLYTA